MPNSYDCLLLDSHLFPSLSSIWTALPYTSSEIDDTFATFQTVIMKIERSCGYCEKRKWLTLLGQSLDWRIGCFTFQKQALPVSLADFPRERRYIAPVGSRTSANSWLHQTDQLAGSLQRCSTRGRLSRGRGCSTKTPVVIERTAPLLARVIVERSD